MTTARTAAVIAAGALLAAWLAAAASTALGPKTPRRQIAVTPARVDDRAGRLQIEADRLRNRLAAQPMRRNAPRNPFQFGARQSRANRTPTPSDAALIPPAIPAAPPLTLSGIAEDGTGAAAGRTAIVSGDGQLYLVKEGESFAGRYRVVLIDATAAEIADSDGTTIRLELR